MNESNNFPQGNQQGGSDRRRRNTSNQEGLSNFVFGKVQPQAVPLEEAVLGALMLDREALPMVMDILRPESFYLEGHQHIYRAVIRLFERSNPVDLLTVTEELKKAGELDKIGGGYYLVELTNRVASAANIEYHARIIAQKHIQRELIGVSTRTIRDAYEDTTDVFNLLDEAEKGLFAITQNNLSRSYESMGTLSSKVLKQIEELSKKGDGLTGVPTGFTDLDRLTSGWQPSDLIILAARPGMGKCLAKGTKVLMYDGSLRCVEDLQSGELLMGDDSSPRTILSTTKGREMMYWVRQNKGMDYRVNESHILSLKRSRNEGPHSAGDVLNIPVKEYINKSNKFKTNYKGYKVAVEFASKPFTVHPYFLGLWLGDGNNSSSTITTNDTEVVDFLHSYSEDLGLTLTPRKIQSGKCPQYTITNDRQHAMGYSLHGMLKEIGVLHHKHIPESYLINNTVNRLDLLAGLIDSDGHYLSQSNGFEITQKEELLAQQIKFLCDSLGFRTSIAKKKAQIASIGYESTVWRVRIYGNIERIPVRIKRKQPNPWKSRVNWQVTGIKVEPDCIDDYFGFELDGNGLFLLEDMTVTHNTSMVLAVALNAARDFNKGVALFSLEMASTQLVQRLISMESEIPATKFRNGKLEDYEWQMLQSTVERLNSVPIFIDDTPGINIFELRAKCRRLKMQYDIQIIIIDYLQLMTGSTEGNRGGNREQEIGSISRALKGLAKELNVPVIALSQLSRAVEVRGGSKRPQLSDLRESGCLTGDTLLTDAISGKRITIKELTDRPHQTPFTSLGMDDHLKVGPQHLVKAFYSGQKQVFELTLHSGRRIKASANHPFFKINGWTALENLEVGDRIATPRKITISSPSNPLSKLELTLLAHLIGDGCILPRSPYHYTSADWTNIEAVNTCARELFGIEARVVPQGNWWHTYLPSPYHLTHGVKHPITKWYEKLGLERVRSFDKRLPDELFQCDESHIEHFLHHLWATDGNISWKTTHKDRQPALAIYYGTTSAILAEQVQHLLLRLGIQSSVKITQKGNHRPSHNIWIEGKENQARFLNQVGCFGARGAKIPTMQLALEAINGNPNNDTIPKEAWQGVISDAKAEAGLSWRTFSSKLETAYSGSSLHQSGISRARMQRVETILPTESIANLAHSDIYWDKIKSITPLGVEDVYDATVLEVHNFVANDFIVHNSIEQDADIVSFIYRPEYYQILEDENGQSLKGIAEFIVAKHRNGALDTVKLKFTDTFAKFSNLDDPSFAGLQDPLSGPFQPSVITRQSRMNDEDIPF
jgi:replicative DNA helicase